MAPDVYELAVQVAEETGGTLGTANSGGYKITIPYGRRGIMIRVMDPTGQYPDGYYRISIPGKEAYDVNGNVTQVLEDTHIPIEEGALDNILSIVETIQGG